MSAWTGWWVRLRRAFQRTHFEAEMAEEMRLHQELEAARQAQTTEDPEHARLQALRAFGPIESYKEQVRDRRFGAGLEHAYQDVRYALRWLRKSPVFTTVAIATLALGLGATTVIFSLVDAVLYRPLDYPQPDRLVFVFETLPNHDVNNPSGGAYLDWLTESQHFESMMLMGLANRNLWTPDGAERLAGARVTHQFLDVLGVQPKLGRGFLPEEDAPGGNNQVVLITEELWRSRLNARPDILGHSVLLDEVPHTVIGVLPQGAWIRAEDQFFIPAVAHPSGKDFQRSPHWAIVCARLRPGVTPEQAEVALRTVRQSLAAEYPSWKSEWSVAVRPLHEHLVRQARAPLWILMGAVAALLLITCLNLAGLLAARANDRQAEMALRSALGASQGRIVRQVLTESLLLAVCGGIGGLMLALWGIALLPQYLGPELPQVLRPALDWRVLSLILVVTAATGLAFGSLPAWRLRRPDLNTALKNGGKPGSGARNTRAQAVLVVGQIAFAIVLLISASLLGRSLVKATDQPLNFDPQQTLAFDLSLPELRYATPEARREITDRILEQLRALPGVESAGGGLAVPGTGGGYGERVWPAGRTATEEDPTARLNAVSPGYFEALRARLITGRLLTASDNQANSPRVAIINETLARTLFGSVAVVGERVNASGTDGPWEIIGVVSDLPYERLDAAAPPAIFLPLVHKPESFAVIVRGVNPKLALGPMLRKEMQRIDPQVAIANLRTVDDALKNTLAPRRMMLRLITGFSLLALLLAAIGIYGTMAYRVSQRKREFSIRLALGASPRDVVQLVLREGLRLIGLGLLLGSLGGIAASLLLRSELYQVPPHDPLSFAGALLVLGLAATIACVWPAWRGARADPAMTLRAE
jgi:predicted permease